MNDESEITYTFDLLTDILTQNNDRICQAFKDSIEKKIQKRTQLPSNLFDYVNRDSIFVACFSTEQDELSLWNYYTKTGSMAGYNIGFKVDTSNALSYLLYLFISTLTGIIFSSSPTFIRATLNTLSITSSVKLESNVTP